MSVGAGAQPLLSARQARVGARVADGGHELFEVAAVTELVDSSGVPVGRLYPGQVYAAVEVGDPWVVVGGPGGSRAFVLRSAVRRIATDPGAEGRGWEPAGPGVPEPGWGSVESAGPAGGSPREEARAALVAMVGRFGPQIADEPRRVEAVLRDMAGEHKGEVTALSAAATVGVGAALLGSSEGTVGGLIVRLAQGLERDRAVAPEMARWAVESWAAALGVGHEIVSEPAPEATGTAPGPVGPATIPAGAGARTRPSEPPAPPPPAPAQEAHPSPSRKRKRRIPMLAGVVVVVGAVGAGALTLTGGSNTPVTATTTSTTGDTTTTTTAATTTRPPTTTSIAVSEPIPPLGRVIVSDTFDSSSVFEGTGQVEGFGTWVWDVGGGSLFLQAEPIGEFSVSSTRPFQLPDSYIVSARFTGPNCGIRLADGGAEALFLIVEENIEFRVQVIGDLDTPTLENGFFGAINPEGGNVLTVYVDGSRALAFINGVEVADVSNPFFLDVLSAGPAARVSFLERSCEVFEFSIHETGA